ncbi:hypothetical protein CVIRNUC_005405 [Coccomyxa viridis]|uniref:phosphoserine phosphatase n=1 Tax=Coccomyxa viridis TaxID=1274662 RepID=A0AAV1I653_9CHLO|nr:hypothetical protein CVIRNUC_005405 [Coccomyxa viridis]
MKPCVQCCCPEVAPSSYRSQCQSKPLFDLRRHRSIEALGHTKPLVKLLSGSSQCLKPLGGCTGLQHFRSIACSSMTELPRAAGINSEPSKEVRRIWETAQAVCFDVDSTLCEDESIDELAAFLNVGEAVAALTASAMGGSVLFQDALKARLDLMQPSHQDVQRFLASHPPRISQGIPELVKALQGRGCQVFLVSGGFRAIINPIAAMLGIPQDHVFANTILFQEDGSFAGFDEKELTSQGGGKASAARLIKEKYDFSRLVMVGDGATDLEARQPGGADIFIGYGGVVERPSIASKADWYVYDIRDLNQALQSRP